MANRYSQGPIGATVQSQFVPLPIEYMEKALQRRQNKYDVSKAITDKVETTLGKFKFLGQDTAKGKEHLQEYRQKIKDMVASVGNDYSRLNAETDILKKDFTADVTGGYLGATTASYQNYATNVSEIDNMVMKGDMTKERADWRKAQLLNKFTGTREDETGWHSYQKQTIGRDFDVEGTMLKLGAAVHDQYTSTGDEYLSLGYVTKRIKANFTSDPEAMNFVADEVKRLYNPKTPEEFARLTDEYISQKAQYAASLQTFYKTSKENRDAAAKKAELSLTTPTTDLVNLPDSAKVNVALEGLLAHTSDIASKINATKTARIGINPVTGLPQEVAVTPEKSKAAITYKNAYDVIQKVTKDNGLVRDMVSNMFTDEQLKGMKPSQLNDAIKKVYKNMNIHTPLSYDSYDSNERIADETLNMVKNKNLAKSTVIDTATGHALSKEQSDEIKANMYRAKATGDEAILKAYNVVGKVNKAGTKFDIGSYVFTGIDGDGKSRTYVLSPNVEVNKRPEYIMSKLLDAENSYKDGIATSTTFRAKSPITGKFVNFDAIGTKKGVRVYDPSRKGTPLSAKELEAVVYWANVMKQENKNHTLQEAVKYKNRNKLRF